MRKDESADFERVSEDNEEVFSSKPDSVDRVQLFKKMSPKTAKRHTITKQLRWPEATKSLLDSVTAAVNAFYLTIFNGVTDELKDLTDAKFQ